MADSSRPGLLAAARRLMSSTAAWGEVRLSLLANDLELEKLRVLDSLSWLALAAVGGAAGLGLFSAGLLMLLQPPQRWWAMLLLGLLYLAGAWFGLGLARQKLRAKPGPFDASLAELRRDQAALTPATSDTAAAPAPAPSPRRTRQAGAAAPAAPAASDAATATAELSAAVAALRQAFATASVGKRAPGPGAP